MNAPRRPVLAIALMLAASVSFVAMQAVVKSARVAGFHTSEVMLYRTLPGLPVLWWSLHRRGLSLRPDHAGNLFARSLFGSVAMGTNFTAMRSLTLAQYATLSLSQPVFVALVAPVLLAERARSHVYVAMALSGLGALGLLAPGLGEGAIALAPALLAVASAFASALAHIWVRKATETDPAERVVFHFSAWVALVALVYGLANGHFSALPADLSPVQGLALVAGLAAFGTLGQVLMTRAYLLGHAASVSTVGYVAVLVSMLADALIWQVVPGSYALVGALLMITGGLVLVRGERAA